MGKYKKALIHKVKQKYGVAHLFFYRGARHTTYIDHEGRSRQGFLPITICSVEGKIKRVYKNNPSVRIHSRFTHAELEYLLGQLMSTHKYNKNINLKTPNNMCHPTYARKVLFEQLDSEFEDIYAIRQASLIAYLSGI